jgi:hypothetical protein
VAPSVRVGDTLRLVARPLNAAGQLVATAQVSWAILDTGVTAFRLDPSGLVSADAAGAAKVQARAAQGTDTLRSDPIIVTVTP